MSRLGHPLSNLEPIITIRFTGFPAADRNVREFFDRGTSQWEVYTRYAAFFTVLFQQLQISFQNIDNGLANVETTDSTASKFRSLMTRDQTYDAPNEYKKTFYDEVCQKAEVLSNGIYTVIRCSYCISCSYLNQNGYA